MLDSAPLAVSGKGVLLWLRTDLRRHDHSALDAAARRAMRLGGQLAFCYVHSPEEDGDDLETGMFGHSLEYVTTSTYSSLGQLPACNHKWSPA